MTFDATEVAARMRRLRRLQGISLRTVGERVGVSQAAVSYAERGSRRLDLQFLNGYAAAIGVDVAALLGGSAPPDEAMIVAPADVLAQLRAAIGELTTAIGELTTHLARPLTPAYGTAFMPKSMLPPEALANLLSGADLRLQRCRLGLSQRQVADLAGMSRGVVADYESGRRRSAWGRHKLGAALTALSAGR